MQISLPASVARWSFIWCRRAAALSSAAIVTGEIGEGKIAGGDAKIGNRFIEGVGSQRDDTEELELNVRVVRNWLGGQLLQFRVIGQGFLVFGGVTFVTCKVVNWFLWFQLINLYIYPNPD